MISTNQIVRVTDIGWKAHAALGRSQGVARVVAVLTDSVYLDAGGTLVWLGRASAALHPRAMLTREALAIRGNVVRVDVVAAAPWTPAPLGVTPPSGVIMRRGGRELRAAIVDAAPPDGLGLLLCETTVGDVTAGADHRARRPETIALLQRAAPQCLALARACVEDDPAAATDAATGLLGLGPGLTPSGDDFVGGALFARSLFSKARGVTAVRWNEAGVEILRRARDLTHPISVALLEDMIGGDGHAPLHDLARALATEDRAAAVDAAQRLVRIGHSSGWDMLAGFVGGADGL